MAETRISAERGWLQRATSNDSVPGTTPSPPPPGFDRVKIAPTSGRFCSIATIAAIRAASAPARKWIAPSETTMSGEPSGSGLANGDTSALSVSVAVCVEKP